MFLLLQATYVFSCLTILTKKQKVLNCDELFEKQTIVGNRDLGT